MSGVSRTSVGEYLGYDFEEEADKLEGEEAIIKAKGLSEFGQQPFSATGKNTDTTSTAPSTTMKSPAKTPAKVVPSKTSDTSVTAK
jgi:hypothetical protein